MKRLRIAVAAALMLSVPGCAGFSNLVGNNLPGRAGEIVAAPLGDKTLRDEQAYYAVSAAYNVPAHAYRAANERRMLSPSLKNFLKPKLIYMYDLLKAARAAYQFGDAAGFAAKKAALFKLRDEITPLIPK